MNVLKVVGTVVGFVVNLAIIVALALSIQTKLDHAISVAENNCTLLKSAIVLSIEQSMTPESRTMSDRIERNFNSITCQQ